MKVIDYQEHKTASEDEVYIMLQHRFLWWTRITQWRGDGVYWRDAATGAEARYRITMFLDAYTKMVKARKRFREDPIVRDPSKKAPA